MTTENNNTPSSERRSWVWIMLMVNIVFVLILMTVGILALRVGNYLPENTDIIFIVGKTPSFEAGDGENKTWVVGKEVDIFKSTYVNGENVITVASNDGTKVIAPGTETSYKFTLNNSGNVAVSYQLDLDFTLKIGEEVQKEYEFPLLVRVKSLDGKYIVGSETEWINVKQSILNAYVSQLGASCYETYILELMWQFDGGNDELDTLYGDLSAEKGVSLRLDINTYAQEHIDPTAQGGTRVDDENPLYGGTIRWFWFILLMLNTALIIFYIAFLMNKRLKKW